MARIRSVHPGLFTDETFVSLSDAAQIFYIGLWTEADDQGLFEWKPLTLKMRLRPCSNSPVDPLLDELLSGNAIKQVSLNGRMYGAIRNFRKYQRPKYPNAVHPIDDETRKYVSLTAVDSGITNDEHQPFPQKAERRSLLEDVVPDVQESPPTPPSGGFDEFWNVYPDKSKRQAAERAFAVAITKAPLTEIMAGVRRYIAAKPKAQAWKSASGWLDAERWKDHPVPVVVQSTGPKRTWLEIKAEKDRLAARQADDGSGPKPISSITPTVLLPVEGFIS